MFARYAGRSLLALFMALLLGLVWAGAASAQTAPGYDSTDGCSGSWIKQFGVDVLILDCQPGFATEHDRAYMFARGPVDTRADWHSQLNFDNSVWLFDTGATGNRASLIIDFHHDGQAAVADLFDDTSGDGYVRYGYERGYPKSAETRFPSVRVTAPDGWWVRGGKINYNLKIEADGPILASWSAELFVDSAVHDGQPDVTIRVYDPTGQGRPKWEIFQATPPVSASSAILRTGVMYNTADDEVPVGTYILWPYLGYKGPKLPMPSPPIRPPLASLNAFYGITKNYNETFPPIEVDWANARIDTIGEFVASRGRAHNFFMYSNLAFGTPGNTLADFENPFAFYDLAGANDGYPDLIIRDAFTAAGDPYSDPLMPGQSHTIRYSWDQQHQLHKNNLSFKVDLYGQRPMPATVDLGDGVKVQSVPYAEYPHWVVDNAWQAGAFVAAEHPLWTTEGIYDWCMACEPIQQSYYSGLTTKKPFDFFVSRTLSDGMRGEYASSLLEPVQLYMSTIDRKLHLHKAETGIWNVKPDLTLRYTAVDGPYINKWEQVTQDVTTQSLYYMGDRVVFADASGVQIARGPSSPVQFTSAPPTDSESWRTLRDQLAAVKPLADPTDLGQIFGQFPDERISLPNAQVWGAHPTADGFTFNLLLPGPEPGVPWTQDLQPGIYDVTYRPSGGFAARPALPSKLMFDAPAARGDPPAELTPIRIRAHVHNGGDADLAQVPVVFLAGRADQASQVIGTTTIDVPAGGDATPEVEWPSPAAGDWQISAAALGEAAATSPATSVHVAPAPAGDIGSLLLAQGLRPASTAAIGASVILVVAIAVGFGFILLPTRRGPREIKG